MKICIDDGSTNIKLAWTENGERRNAISPNSFKSEWSAPFGGMQPADTGNKKTPRIKLTILNLVLCRFIFRELLLENR